MKSDALVLIVVQGAIAVGKSTLVRRLQQHYNIGAVTKDGIKELLYDTVGTPIDREQSRVYGSAAMHGLYAMSRRLLESGIGHIIESAYKPVFANQDIKALIKDLPVHVIQIYCYTTPEVQLQRYNARLQDHTRHPAHPDSPQKIVDDFILYTTEYTPLDILDTISIDTTTFGQTEFTSLCKTLESKTGGALHAHEAAN